MELVLSLPWESRPSQVQKKRLTDLTATALEAEWPCEELRSRLIGGLGGVQSRYAVWKSRLENLPEPDPVVDARPVTEPTAPCGQCGPGRLVEHDDGRVSYCRCHPKFVTEGAAS